MTRRTAATRRSRFMQGAGGLALTTGLTGGLGWAAGDQLFGAVRRGGRKLRLLRLFARKGARVIRL